MTELVPHQSNALTEQIAFAKALAPAGMLPREYQQNPANLLFALQYADALDVKPIHAITSIHVINGKPSASAELIASVVRRAGHKLRVEATDTEATATLIRRDDQGFEYTATWDLERAKTAGLTSNPTWKKFPSAMLRSRAITEVCRMGASDALYGVQYTPDELGGDFIDAPTVEAAVTPATTKVSRKRKPAPEPVEAEVVEPPAIESNAGKRMFALLNEKVAPEQHKPFIEDTLGHDVPTRKDLTGDEISAIINRLESM